MSNNFLLYQTADDEGNAQCVKHLYGTRFLHCDAYGWLRYNGRFWVRDLAEATLDRAVVKTLVKRRMFAVCNDHEAVLKATRPSAYNVRACRTLFQSLVAIPVTAFDRSPDELNCQNGVVNLRTGVLTPHHHKQRFTYCLPVDYDPNADSTMWESFLLEAVGGSREVADYLQLAVGYSLTGHTQEEFLFYIHGPTRAGKGTFTETILKLLGKPLAVEVDFTSFTADRDHDTQNFDLAPLKPCRFVVASESKEHQKLNTAKIKQLTGGNEVRCAFKYKDHFEYRPQFKIWLASNFPPNVDVDDDAVWARLQVIKFPNSYAGKEDKTLKRRMRSKEHLTGVLAWAVKGAMAWYEKGGSGLHAPQLVQAATKDARDELDFVGQWLSDQVEYTGNPSDFLAYEPLHEAYATWCRENGATPMTLRGLTSALKGKNYETGAQRKVDGMNKKSIVGIRLR